ncbi:hypothetical protein K3G63_03315 [Hymenobacter sp. HSC-4F20]|uniref:hypothetical protein n=1 Tax=Hymenobacter sp. HSC-4F20 TaxID=2864135 RepID=UPI001C72D4BF|nr:hypothetical protein [Hymenobacter sp. HSC-4F20]MBX0289448.1 hypothetical protein [Hymenobacter sp. HSC-4F20]
MRTLLHVLLVAALPLCRLTAQTQAAPNAATTRTPDEYSTATIRQHNSREWILLATDAHLPKSQDYVQDAQGKTRVWKSQAAVLNYLAQQGWFISPIGVEATSGFSLFHYLLRRPAQ